eukprot:gene8637-9569_t
MAVGNTGVTWKSIIGYFFYNKVLSGVLAQLTRTVLNFMADAGFVVVSIIWDGTYQEAARCLGCRFGSSYEPLATAFPHPSCFKEKFFSMHVLNSAKRITSEEVRKVAQVSLKWRKSQSKSPISSSSSISGVMFRLEANASYDTERTGLSPEIMVRNYQICIKINRKRDQ